MLERLISSGIQCTNALWLRLRPYPASHEHTGQPICQSEEGLPRKTRSYARLRDADAYRLSAPVECSQILLSPHRQGVGQPHRVGPCSRLPLGRLRRGKEQPTIISYSVEDVVDKCDKPWFRRQRYHHGHRLAHLMSSLTVCSWMV